jgi:hypothetical protein
MVPLLLVVSLVLQQQQSPRPRVTGPVPSAAALAADTGVLRNTNGRPAPYAEALRIRGAAPRVDGELSDAIWAVARPVTEFTQNEPHDGEPASERTEVRIVYDDGAIYVAARMYDSEPTLVRSQLGRRDSDPPADEFRVDFDSYHDHRTAFGFGVNAAGVRQDVAYANDVAYGDLSWDPVWEVVTRRDSLGWTAEMRIPLSQLRFANAPVQVWGVHFRRWIHHKAESADFGWSSQTDNGFASWFGHLHSLRGLPQPRRFEALPYVTATEERIDPGADANPFNDGSRERLTGGLDLKYGLTSNLTLDATINPDFGQVEADPALVNLTAFESFFPERRPFYVEGAEIFRFGEGGAFRVGGANYFYSRRIGRAPQGFARARGGFVDASESSTILGAGKLSGRTAGGWSLGLLEAVTAREYATVDSMGVRFRDEVEPLTSYTVVRGRRDSRRGASTVGFIGTAVNRDIGAASLDFLRTAAYAGGVDFTHRFNRNRHMVWGSVGLSQIRGDTLAIQRAQLSSARYFQRPDAHHVQYDPARTSLAGWMGTLGFSKDAGDWVYGVTGQALSPGFEINDVGFQMEADDATIGLYAMRRWTRPGHTFRSGIVQARASAGWNFGGDRTASMLAVMASGQLLNYWSLNGILAATPRTVNDNLTRGGPAGISPATWEVGGGFSTDFRKALVLLGGGYYARNDLGGWSAVFYASLEARPSPTIEVSVKPTFSASRSQQQYLRAQLDPAATGTFGTQYVFAEILQHTLDLTTRLDLTLTPSLSLQLYAQPFVASGDFARFKELRTPRTTEHIVYGETSGSTILSTARPDGGVAYYLADPDGVAGSRRAVLIPNPDFSYRSLRGNAVVRWEWRPGSTLFLVWTANCSAYLANPAFTAVDDLRRLCQGPSDNVFAVKLSYWLSR